MKTIPYLLFLFAITVFPFIACKKNELPDTSWTPANYEKQFSDYWYQGKAEITHYELEQARYGEIHRGDAVLIFVTEDFLPDKQVKLEDYSKGKANAASILKLNFTKTFNTGIYPYTMMLSVFSPVEINRYPHALKVNATATEWCGQVYTQINNRPNGFNVKSFSYFEKEGDEDFLLDKAFLEDEIWTRIRLSPDRLPLGDIKLVPGILASRLRHIRLAVETAQTAVRTHADTVFYSVRYPNSGRSLDIQFRNEFPHDIFSWNETYKDGFGEHAKILTTRAVKKKSILLDYWNKHAVADSVYRKELGF